VTAVLTLLLLLAFQAPALPSQPAPSPDPANAAFAGTAGMMLVAIKPAATADYESIIRELQAALAADTNVPRKAATKGWHVFKAAAPDAKGNALYIHIMLPAVPGFDYRPSLLVDGLVKDLAPELLTKYRDAFAGPPTKLDLSELAHMAVAPLPQPDVKSTEIKKPGR
jgi:hypothetical protein